MAVAVCTGGGVDMTETNVDTSWAFGSSVSSGGEVGNTCTGNTAISSRAGCVVDAAGVLESPRTGSIVADVWTGRRVSGSMVADV